MNALLEKKVVPIMRIAVVNSNLWLGGGTVFMLNLCGAFIRRGITTQVFCMNGPDNMRSDFEKAGIPLWFGPENEILEDSLSALYQALREFSPSIVVINIGLECEVFRITPAHVERVIVGHTLVSQMFDMVSLYTNHCEAIVGVSHQFTQEMRHRLGDAKAPLIQTIELGVPLPDCLEAQPDPSEAIRIIYLGRLEDSAKRVRLFPGIYDQLVASGTPFVWTIVGEGPEMPFLEKAMPSLGPNQHVSLVGRVPYHEVPLLLQKQDVILLTSDTESFSLSLHEGMSFGLIPVVSDIPGRVREVVTEEVGLRVPIDEPEKFAPALQWLHEHREVWPRMKESARSKISEQYSVSAMVDRWMDFLHRLPEKGSELPWVPNPRIARPYCLDNKPHLSSTPVRFLRRFRRWLLRLVHRY